MKPRKRFNEKEIIGGAQKLRTFVPGVNLLSKDRPDTVIKDPDAAINLALLLYKYPKWLKSQKQNRTVFNLSGEMTAIDGRKKRFDYEREHLEDIVHLSSYQPLHYDQLKRRHYLDQDGFVLTTASRLLTGFSGGSVFENAINLHPYYGFPVIAGAGQKGLARHFAEEYMVDLDRRIVQAIFGRGMNDPEDENSFGEGNVIFMDAWPEAWRQSNGQGEPLLDVDILNPHYGDYYNDKNADTFPTDNLKLSPNLFLAVRDGVSFRFCILPTARCNDRNLVTIAAEILKKALTTYGAGAKTGSNYGYFE